ncbi:MAG: hypothetical protein H7138_23645 [Myxococcales bacterium]|nr:hypothetical protein [Myxococcales bacterium]
MKPENTPHRDPNQGEGDKVAARHYNEQLREFVAGDKVEPAAREAKAYVDEHPIEAKRAERQGKRGPASRVSLDELLAKGKSIVDRARPIVERAVGKLRARIAGK